MNLFKRIGQLFRRKTDLIPIFSQQATLLCQASDILNRMVSTDDIGEWRKCEREIKRLEVQGDAVLTDFHRMLPGRLMWTSNRWDLQSIAMLLDDCLDTVEDSARSLILYLPKQLDSHLQELSELIRSGAYALKELVPMLADVAHRRLDILHSCERVTELEHSADKAYEEYVGYIFSEVEDLREMTKYKNIAEVFESATDNEKRVSDTVRKLLLK